MRLEARRQKEALLQSTSKRGAEIALSIGAERAAHAQVCVDLSLLAKQMKRQQQGQRSPQDYDARIEAALTAARAMQSPQPAQMQQR